MNFLRFVNENKYHLYVFISQCVSSNVNLLNINNDM